MFGNFTDGRADKVKEESSMNSTIGLEKISLSRRQNLMMLNDTNGNLFIHQNLEGDNESDFRETKERYTDGFFKDYLMNQRPDYGDKSDHMQNSRKLYY